MRMLLLPAIAIIVLATLFNPGGALAADYGFELTEITSGEELTEATAAPGIPIVVFVWSANCPHCRIHMPYVAQLYDRLDPEAAGFVSIVVDTTKQEARDYIAERGLEFPVLMAGSGDASDEYLELGWPTTFVLNPDGSLAGICETQGPEYVENVLDLVERAGRA